MVQPVSNGGSTSAALSLKLPFWRTRCALIGALRTSVHWCLDVAFNDDQMRARKKNAGANLAIIRRLVLNLFRLDTTKTKGGIYTRRILAASSDPYRAQLLGLSEFDAIALESPWRCAESGVARLCYANNPCGYHIGHESNDFLRGRVPFLLLLAGKIENARACSRSEW